MQRSRKFAWRSDSYALAATGFAAFDIDLALGYTKALCKEFNQMRIRLTIDRRGCYADFELSVMFSDEFVGGGLGLQATIQDQIVALPVVPGCAGIEGRVTHGTPSSWNSVLMACSSNRARMGEKSIPLMGGSKRRKGRNTGSLT